MYFPTTNLRDHDTSIKLTLFLVAIIISSMNIDERDAVMHI